MKNLFWNYSLHAFLVIFLQAIISFESQAQNTDLEAEKNLVSFFPEIYLYSKTACQGLRVSSSQIVTSPGCILEISKTLNQQECIEARDVTGNTLGSIFINNHTVFSQTTDSTFLLTIDTDRDYESQFSPALYSSQSLPSDAFAFYLDEQDIVAKEKIALTAPDSHQNTRHFILESAQPLPQGAPVYDKDGKFICLVTSDDECRALPPDLTQLTDHWSFIPSLDYSITDILIGAGIFLAITVGGISAVKVIISALGFVVYFACSFILTTPQAQCSLMGGCADGCGYCQ